MSERWIVLVFTDYAAGADDAYGPFSSEEEATDWAVDFNADCGWEAVKLRDPSEAGPGDRESVRS